MLPGVKNKEKRVSYWGKKICNVKYSYSIEKIQITGLRLEFSNGCLTKYSTFLRKENQFDECAKCDRNRAGNFMYSYDCTARYSSHIVLFIEEERSSLHHY